MCIDICPVGALTSGTYRYKSRPWEMNHVATVCTHCGDGCKTTLGVRSVSDGSEIMRGDNRDKSGINGDFLCNKGRYAFDFANSTERLAQPLVRQSDGTLKPVSWEEALTFAGTKLRELRDQRGPNSIGVIGSNRTTNEENYLLQKFARTVIGTNNIDHHRTADFVTLATSLQGTLTPAGKTRFASAALHRDRPRHPPRRRRPHQPCAAHRLEHPHQRPPQQGPRLHRQPRRDQAPPPGHGLRTSRPVRLRSLHQDPR